VPHTEIEVDLPTADQQSGSDDEGEDIELIDDTDNENENANEDEAVETVVPIDDLALDPVPSRSIDYVNSDDYPSSNDRSDEEEDDDDDDGDFNSVSK
jgi:hypothetical protein